MCHYSEFYKITYVNCWRNDLKNDVKLNLQNLINRESSSPKEEQMSLNTLIEKFESLEFLTSSQML